MIIRRFVGVGGVEMVVKAEDLSQAMAMATIVLGTLHNELAAENPDGDPAELKQLMLHSLDEIIASQRILNDN